MMIFHKLIATFFGIGYIGKGGGTVAAAVACIIWMVLPAGIFTHYWQVLTTCIVCCLGVWSSNVVDSIWGKDSSKVVIDEVAGVMITLLFVPLTLWYIIAGLVLFRFFDIAKPLLIRKMETLPRGLGVMGDDMLAGLYAHITLKIIIKLFQIQH